MNGYQILNTTWTEQRKALTTNRAPYYTKRNVNGYSVYRGGQYIARFYRLRDAKAFISNQ